jgi:hypothetical protein
MNFVEIRFWGSFKISNVRNPRVVHQDIYVIILKYLVESDSNVLLNRNVTTTGLRVPASSGDLDHHCSSRGLIDIEDVDTCPGLGKRCCNRPPNTACASGYYSGFTSKTMGVASSFQMNPPPTALT